MCTIIATLIDSNSANQFHNILSDWSLWHWTTLCWIKLIEANCIELLTKKRSRLKLNSVFLETTQSTLNVGVQFIPYEICYVYVVVCLHSVLFFIKDNSNNSLDSYLDFSSTEDTEILVVRHTVGVHFWSHLNDSLTQNIFLQQIKKNT